VTQLFEPALGFESSLVALSETAAHMFMREFAGQTPEMQELMFRAAVASIKLDADEAHLFAGIMYTALSEGATAADNLIKAEAVAAGIPV